MKNCSNNGSTFNSCNFNAGFSSVTKNILNAITVLVMEISQVNINQVVTYRNHNCQFLKTVFLMDLFKQTNKILGNS